MAPGNATVENNDGIMTTPAAAAAPGAAGTAASPTSNEDSTTTTTESFESRLDQLLQDLEQMEHSGTTGNVGDRDATIQAFAKFLQEEEEQQDHKRNKALPRLSLPRLIGVPQKNVDQAVRLAHQSVAVLVQGVSRVAQESVHLAQQLNTTKVSDSEMTYEQALDKVGKSATGLVKIMADLVQDSATFVASELQQQQQQRQQQQALARQDQKRQQEALHFKLQLQAATEQDEQEEAEEDTTTFDKTPWSNDQRINQGQEFFHNLFQSASHVVNELQDKVDTSFLSRNKKQYNNNNNNNNNNKDDAKTIGTPPPPPAVTREQSTGTSKQGQSGSASASASWNNVPFFLQKNDF